MAIDVKWFQDRIRDLGTSQRQISSAIASNPNTMSLILKGKRRVAHAEIPALAQLLDTTSEEVLKRLGVDAPLGTVSDVIECIGVVDETGVVQRSARTRTVQAPSTATAITRGVIFTSAGGEAFQHGWVYYFDLPASPRGVDADSLNRLCLVEIGDKAGQHLGVVRRALERGRYDLVNVFTSELIVGNVAIRSANPIIWIKTA